MIFHLESYEIRTKYIYTHTHTYFIVLYCMFKYHYNLAVPDSWSMGVTYEMMCD